MAQGITVEERMQQEWNDQISPIIRIDEVAPEHVLPSDTGRREAT